MPSAQVGAWAQTGRISELLSVAAGHNVDRPARLLSRVFSKKLDEPLRDALRQNFAHPGLKPG